MSSPTGWSSSASVSDTCRNASATGKHGLLRKVAPMAEDVSRLKELLFDREARAITDLSTRMDAVFERSGSQERFTASVASVLDEALARAEVDRHTQVAGAIAPL